MYRNRLALAFFSLGLLQWVYAGIFTQPWISMKYRLFPIYTILPCLSGASFALGWFIYFRGYNVAPRVLIGLVLGAVTLGLTYVVVIICALGFLILTH